MYYNVICINANFSRDMLSRKIEAPQKPNCEDKALIKKFLSSAARRVVLVLFDMLTFLCVNFGYLYLSNIAFFSTPVSNLEKYYLNSVVLFICIFMSRFVFRIYSYVWRYTNTMAYLKLVVFDLLGGATSAILVRFVLGEYYKNLYIGIWHAITVTSINVLAALSSRFVYRLLYKYFNSKNTDTQHPKREKSNIAIVGAGQLGAYLAGELTGSSKAQYSPKFFIDSDKTKINKFVAGLPVFSSRDSKELIEKYGVTTVVLAIGKADAKKMEQLWQYYSALGCKVKTFDAPFYTDSAETGKNRIIREFSIEDLLFRKPISVSERESLGYYSGKTVLVTGGGGSIGSEICRQIAKCQPKRLVIIDIYENNAYDIQQELNGKYGKDLDLCVEIGSVRDRERLDSLFAHYRPEIVFHAAAHKHVPLMEHSACEAIKNNVIGTYNTADMAEKYGAEKFILISTDKAVNPTNVMGASKRLCEMIVQCRVDSKTSFAAVRFGNVLGSNGSVIPLFKRQIAAGGPITITDKRIIRYFMTIPEASQLVMLAGTKAKKGELFVLDMGQPVRIYDLAMNMIKLMGYIPDEDIEIKEIGLRPGEKLYEELLMKNESVTKTDNDMIFIEKDTPYTREEVNEKLDILRAAVAESRSTVNSKLIKEAMKKVVPTFYDPEVINATASESEEMKTTA